VAGFRSRADELKALGVGLYFVGNGTPAMASEFRDYMQMGALPVWTDPKRQTYAHLGFKRGWMTALSPAVWKYGARAAAAGFKQGKQAGDPIQQGGVLVVKRGGELVYGYASATAGDHPPIDEVMAKARLAAQA
jgi:prostamide/prostaglandin F2alpha synthase